jgi:hypothetical protein
MSNRTIVLDRLGLERKTKSSQHPSIITTNMIEALCSDLQPNPHQWHRLWILRAAHHVQNFFANTQSLA